MIRLHYSNCLEKLIPPLAAGVAEHQSRRPLERVAVIVPNRAVEEFVKLRLCEQIGVAANLGFPFLRGYLARIVNDADAGLLVLEAEDLHIVLFERLRALAQGKRPEFDAVREYIGSGSRSGTDAEIRTFQLAGQVARLFREYSITRREMLSAWRRGPRIAEKPFDAAERWQRHLWLSVFGDDGAVRPELVTEEKRRWMLLPDAFAALEPESLRSALPATLHVFGLAYAGPAFARIFARIGELTDLRIYAVNPCLEFWEDVDLPSGIARESWVHRKHRLGSGLESAPDPFQLDTPGDTPALRLWSRPGREYVRLLNELTDCDFDPHFAHPGSAAAPNLLQRLQESILIREPERKPQPAAETAADDGSIRFLACPGIRREAEIAANAIWSLLRRDEPGARRLRFHEIAVLVPDRAYGEYLPHVETAFAEQHGIPVNVVNRRFASESRVAQAIAMLLQLPLGRFTRHEMLHLLTHPAVTGAGNEIGWERWPEWCDALGVFFGADQRDLAATYIPQDLFHWDQALKRLALGVFMAGERSGDPRLFRAGESGEYLPLEAPQDEIADAAKMIRLARGLLSDATAMRSQRLALGEWARVLSNLVFTYITPTDPVGERIRDHCVSAIESIATPAIRSEPVAYQTACELVSARIADLEARRGQFAETGVVVGPLSALRAIPFRVIFLLGLNEAEFPERSRHDPLDLRLARRKAGDVTPTERDRYLFLETLLAARERIFLSYLARNAQTGDRLEPSTVIRELQFILRGYLGEDALKSLTIEHPVSRYDFGYFPELAPGSVPRRPELESFDPDARRGARMAALRHDLARHCKNAPLPSRDDPLLDRLAPETKAKLAAALRVTEPPRASASQTGLAPEIWLPLSALRKFLECPIQGAAAYALGMAEDDEGAPDDYQDEPVAQSPLDRAVLLRDAFWKARGDQDAAEREYAAALRAAQAHGRAPAGPFAEAAARADHLRLREWIAQARAAGVGDLTGWVDVRIGRADEFAHAERLIDEIRLELPTPDCGGAAKVRIYGTAGFMSPRLDASLRCILRDKPGAKDFLGLFLSAVALAAAGHRAPAALRAIVAGDLTDKDRNHVKTFLPPCMEDARNYLAALAAELLFGKNHYFIPIEAVEAAAGELRKDAGADLIEAIEKVREREKPCSSDYGPVRNARRFDPPQEDEAARIIRRRFEPIMGIFGE